MQPSVALALAAAAALVSAPAPAQIHGDALLALGWGQQSISIGISLGLLTALCWGLSDLTVRGVSRHGTAAHHTLLATSCASILWMSLVLVLGAAGSPQSLLRSGSRSGAGLGSPFSDLLASLSREPRILDLLVVCGALYALENLLIYRALACAALTLASPIINAWPALTVGLALLTGERPGALALVGMAIIFGGVLLLSLQRGSTHRAPATPIFMPRAGKGLIAAVGPGTFTAELLADPPAELRDALLPFDPASPQLTSALVVRRVLPLAAVAAAPAVVVPTDEPGHDMGDVGDVGQEQQRVTSENGALRFAPLLAQQALRLTPPQSRHITIPFTALTLPAGIPAAVGACLIQGVELWLLRYAILPGRDGTLVTSWLLRLEGLALLLLFVAWELIGTRAIRQFPVRSGWRLRQRGRVEIARPTIPLPRWWHLLRAHPRRLLQRGLVLGLVGLFDVAGLTAYLTGLRVAPTTLVATLASLSGAVVAVVALAIFRERPSAVQWIGLATTLCGVVLATQATVGAA